VSAIEPNVLGELRERTLARYVPISRDNYDWVAPGRWLFCHGGDGILSILDVYALVKDLGRREPGTLVELSFISHAWAGGPSLVNSDDRVDRTRIGPAPDDEPRDPMDRDGRRFKDFRRPTTTPEDLGLMQSAFAECGYIWNWGCNNSHASADVLAQVVSGRAQAGEEPDGPERLFEFTFTPDQRTLYFEVDDTFFPADRLVFRRSVREVTAFLRKRMMSTYNGQAALALGKPCFGALPGMPSDIERSGRFPQMVVPHTPDYSVNRCAELRFYEQYLGVSFDSEGRRYGEYSPRALTRSLS
jgi:hypothetical protein